MTDPAVAAGLAFVEEAIAFFERTDARDRDRRPSLRHSMALVDELKRLRAAAADAIECRNGAECGTHGYLWGACCDVRRAFVQLGLVDEVKRAEEEPDGA